MRRTTLDIYITEVCNLDCEYCYVDIKKDESQKVQPENLMERINLLEYETIKFYGGEPLIRWKEIRDIIESVHEKNPNIHFAVITNGLLLSDEKLQFFQKHTVAIAISIHYGALKRSLRKENLEMLYKFRDIITFNLLFSYKKEKNTTKLFLFLAWLWFSQFSLAPVSNDPWENLDELKNELNTVTKYIEKHPSVGINEANWNELKNLYDGWFCTKEQIDHLWERKTCTRFSKAYFLENEKNRENIDTLFETVNECHICENRWFCVCNKGWYLDNFWASEQYIEEQVRIFHEINETFILFYKKIAKIKNKLNYLTEHIDEIRFNLTEQCNLRCNYCYLSFSNDKLDSSIGKNIIDFFLEQKEEVKTISFFWWEPLLEFWLLKELTLYARSSAKQKGKHVNFKIATNGLLLSDEVISFLQENDFEIHISINGSKALHDKTRDSSYEKLLPKLKLLKKYSYSQEKVIALFVIFPEYIEKSFENVIHLESLWIQEIYLEMYIEKSDTWKREHYEKLIPELSRMYEYSREKTINIRNFWISQEKITLDISTKWRVSDNSLSFFSHNKEVDFSPKRYLSLACKKIAKHYNA